MKKIDRHIEIVSSDIIGLSSMSQKSRLAALAVLARHYRHVGITIVNTLTDLERLVAEQPDLVFLGMKYVPGSPNAQGHTPDKIWLSEYLSDHGIACTGSDEAAHELELDKSLAKQCIARAGLATSPFVVARQNKPLGHREITLSYPLFIKPTDRGGGAGVDSASLATNFEELQAKVETIRTKLQADALIEEYLPGREFSVAILKDELSGEYMPMPLELVAPPDKNGHRFLSSKIKGADLETHKPVQDGELKARITELAMSAFHALGARDYGRIDIRLDAFGTAHFLEANLIPSLIKDYGNFPKACLVNRRMDYEAMILHIVDLALLRAPLAGIEQYFAELSILGHRVAPEAL